MNHFMELAERIQRENRRAVLGAMALGFGVGLLVGFLIGLEAAG